MADGKVNVKGYTRVVNGKVVKVKPHSQMRSLMDSLSRTGRRPMAASSGEYPGGRSMPTSPAKRKAAKKEMATTLNSMKKRAAAKKAAPAPIKKVPNNELTESEKREAPFKKGPGRSLDTPPEKDTPLPKKRAAAKKAAPAPIKKAANNELTESERNEAPFKEGPGRSLDTPPEDDLQTAPEVLTALKGINAKGRPDGAGTMADPIDVGGDLEKAVQLISEGKHVRLNQPDEVSMVLERLAARVEHAKKLGDQAPNFNLCLISVPGTNLFCVDEQTEIMTENGWQRYSEVTVGTQALTLDHATGLSRWEPVEAVNIFEPEWRHVLSIEGKVHSSLTTLDHRWAVVTGKRADGPVRGWTTSGEGFKWEDAVPLAAPRSDSPTEAKYTDALVALVAWTWTEGTFGKGEGLRIYQSETKNPSNCALIRASLTAAFGPARENHGAFREARSGSRTGEVREAVPAWRETYVADTGMVSFHLNKPASAPIRAAMDSEKAVLPEFLVALTEAQLNLFVDLSIKADGHTKGAGRWLGQRKESRARSFEMACALLGIPTHTIEQEDRREGHEGKSTYTVCLSTRTVMKPKNLNTEIKFYDGLVWCPTTPTGTWLARRDGAVFFTGNCTESKGVPRAKMPQLSGTPTEGSRAAQLGVNAKGEAKIEGEFRQALLDLGVKVELKTVKASHLKASQAELDGPKVAGMSKAMEEGKIPDAPIFVTRDGYIVDGHHRWASKVAIDLKDGVLGDVDMPVDMIDLDIGAVLDFANEFALAMGIKPKGLGAASESVSSDSADPLDAKVVDPMDAVQAAVAHLADVIAKAKSA